MAAPLLTDGLIDDKGRVLARDKHPLGRSLRDLNYLICELGFVNFRAHTDINLMTICFNSYRLVSITLAALYFILADYRPEKVMLTHGGELEKHTEVQSNFLDAIHMIETITRTATAETGTFQPDVQWQRRSLDASRLNTDVDSIVGALYERGGTWDADLYSKLASAGVLGNAAVIQSEKAGSILKIMHWGQKRDALGQRWINVASGLNVEDQPFKRIGRRLARLYRRALADNEPRLDDVDWVVPGPDGTIIRRQFERLILPCSDHIINITTHRGAE